MNMTFFEDPIIYKTNKHNWRFNCTDKPIVDVVGWREVWSLYHKPVSWSHGDASTSLGGNARVKRSTRGDRHKGGQGKHEADHLWRSIPIKNWGCCFRGLCFCTICGSWAWFSLQWCPVDLEMRGHRNMLIFTGGYRRIIRFRSTLANAALIPRWLPWSVFI